MSPTPLHRNVFLAIAMLLASVQMLDFLSFHNLFGPWAVIIGKLMVDLGRFLVILAIFVFGFSMFVAAIYNPVKQIYSDFNATSEGSGYPPSGESFFSNHMVQYLPAVFISFLDTTFIFNCACYLGHIGTP